MADDEGFVSRWSRRKAQVRQGLPLAPEPSPAPALAPLPAPVPAAVEPAAGAPPATPPEAPPEPAPTLEDARRLTPASDFARFVRPDVEPAVKQTALKTLFSDPQFNVMDGLDVYIDDYGKPDPLPAAWLGKMAQASFLRLLDTAPEATAEATAEAAPSVPPSPAPPETTEPPAVAAAADEDPDLRLQPDDAAGCAGPGPGPGAHAGGEP